MIYSKEQQFNIHIKFIRMKKRFIILTVLFIAFTTWSCSDDENEAVRSEEHTSEHQSHS